MSWFEDAAPTMEHARALAHEHGIYLEPGLLVVLNRDQFPFEQDRPIVVDPTGEVV